MARLWRVYHPEMPTRRGATFELSSGESRHMRRVLRLRAGESVAVFDGRGNEWRAVLTDRGRDRVTVELEAPMTRTIEPALDVVVYQGLCKPERMDWVIQKTTEVGVAAVCVVNCGAARPHTVTPRRLERWRRIAAEACKQSGRRRLPRIEVGDALPGPVPAETLGLLLDGGEGVESLALRCRRRNAPCEVWLAVGPEGGFAEQEIAAARGAGWLAASLGPRTLRADTAALVAASVVLHRWADLGTEGV